MKKSLFLGVMAATMLFATSCQKEEDLVFSTGENAMVSFSVSTPEIATRAFSDGTTATQLQYAVYNEAGDLLPNLVDTIDLENGRATVNLPLITGDTYSVIFWAAAENAPYNVDFMNKAVAVNYTNAVSNDEARDAFYKYETFAVSGNESKTVQLTRPFAQINIGTNDFEDAKNGDFEPTLSSVTVKGIADTLSFDGSVRNKADRTFALDTIPDSTVEEFPVEGYAYVAMNYVLVGADKEVVDVTFTMQDETAKSKTRTVGSVPVQRNYRTNIYGSLLTSDIDVNVEIEPDFNEPANEAEALYLAAAVGGTVTLEEDVDLTKPLEVQANMVLNLNGHTISASNNAKQKHVIKNNARLVINGGTISSLGNDGGSAVYNKGTLELNGVTVNGAPIVGTGETAGWWPSYAINNYGEMTVNDVTVNSYHGAIATGGDGVTVIEDATVDVGQSTETNQTSWALYVHENGQLTVNGGTFSNTKDEKGEVYGGGYISASSTKQTIINGGTFNKSEADNNGTGFYYNCENLVVKGGTFDVNPPAAYLADGYAAVDNGNGTWTVAAKAGDVAALAAALAAGGEVALNDNIEVSESLVIPEGVEVTLLLNGKTLTGTNTQADVPVVKNEGKLTVVGGTISSTAENGPSAIYNYGTLVVKDATIQGAQNGASGNASYALNTTGNGSSVELNNVTIKGRGAVGATNGTKVEINGGTYHTPEANWGHAVYASGAGTEVVINGGTFTEGYTYANDLWGMYQIYAGQKAKVIVNDGDFSQEWDCANGYDLATATEGEIEIKGGVFADNPASQNGVNYVAAGYIAVAQTNGTYKVEPIIKDGVSEIELGDAHPYATIVVDRDITIKGDTKVKTITSTTGGTITIQDGKTLTLNNFSFGSDSNPSQTYRIEGGTVEANYGFFQHGTYELHSDFETGYMYYSFGSNITVYGTFHSTGAGDGLDYVRGNLTIAAGGKSIHDKSLWVGQPESWGAMTASLTIEPGGYVEANTLQVYTGSSLTYTNDDDLGSTPVDKGGTITKL